MPHCLGAVGSGSPAACLGLRATDLLLHTASLPGGSGQWNSCYTPPHCLGAVGSGTPAIHRRTAWGQWAVEVWYGVVWYVVVWCSVVWCGVVCYGMVRCDAVWCSAVMCADSEHLSCICRDGYPGCLVCSGVLAIQSVSERGQAFGCQHVSFCHTAVSHVADTSTFLDLATLDTVDLNGMSSAQHLGPSTSTITSPWCQWGGEKGRRRRG